MFPFQPPFPTASNFPFQFDAGSQTSILISDSLDGFNVAAIRQNAGRSLNCAPAPRPPPPAGANPPAATVCARVTVVSGSLRAARLSHGPAAAGRVTSEVSENDQSHLVICRVVDPLVDHSSCGGRCKTFAWRGRCT